jgi:DNA-binding MarR family transcriptional regulator
MPENSTEWAAPSTMAELHLPPTFVADHLIRTLSYQGSMSIIDIARHWHVHGDIAQQAIEPLKAAGLLESESSKVNFDALNRVRLSSAGQARIATARARTWYAGPLPVSLEDVQQRMSSADFRIPRDRLAAAISRFCFDRPVADEVGQAIASGAALCLSGLAFDEQQEFAWAVSQALPGQVAMPYAMYAAGSVIRAFDARIHVALRDEQGEDESRGRVARSQWAKIARPAVIISGAVLNSDVLPPFDEEARFYLAPAPMLAFGGVLALCDAHQSHQEVLREFARLWLAPGRMGMGIMLLRSGERIEVPWRSSTLIMSDDAWLAEALFGAVAYRIDVSALHGDSLARFVGARLSDRGIFDEAAVSRLAGLLGDAGLASRHAAAHAARYLRDRCTYEGDEFETSDAVLRAAVEHAAGTAHRPTDLRRAA